MKAPLGYLWGKFDQSVALRYLSVASSFLLAIQLAFGWLQNQKNYGRQVAYARDRVETKAAFLRDVAPEAIFTSDFLYLETLMQQTTEEQDVVYSIVVNGEGRPLTRYLDRDQPLIQSALAATNDSTDLLELIEIVNQSPDVSEVTVSVDSFDHPLGEIRVGYSTARVWAESVRSAQQSFMTALAVSLLLALLTVVLFQRQVHRPLTALRKFAQGVEGGDLNQRIQIQHRDEIGQVGRALNRMADQLQANLTEVAESRDEAIAASKAKSEFLANMSHELRTPLNAILGFSELMSHEAEVSESQKRTLGIINRSGEHLLSLINDVLEMAKIESGRTIIDTTPFDLHRLLDGIHEMLDVRAQAQDIELRLEYAKDQLPQCVEADENKLRQVLLNLVGNAVKFTRQGHVTLRVEAAATDRDTETAGSHFVSFSVVDTGPGISASDLTAIFEPFKQTPIGRNTHDGAGLGLAISRRFVQLMGGDLTASSQLGEGATFMFSIPVLAIATAALAMETPKPRRIIGLAPGQAQRKILVVDDVEENRFLLTKVLELIGFEVEVATNGMEAIECWKSWQPDLIWMDMRMPVMDGFEATRCIRDLESSQRSTPQNPSEQTTIVVALTAFAFEEHRQMTLDAGCDDYVRKPFREYEVLEKMAQHLGVQYRYEGEMATGAEGGQGETQQQVAIAAPADVASQMAAMPRDWLTEVHDASTQLDRERVSDLILQVSETHGSLAERLKGWVTGFRFDKITEQTSLILEVE